MTHMQFFIKPHWLYQQNVSNIYWVKALEMLTHKNKKTKPNKKTQTLPLGMP